MIRSEIFEHLRELRRERSFALDFHYAFHLEREIAKFEKMLDELMT